MVLLALSNIAQFEILEENLSLYDIQEIIEYHQKHHNLTPLAYQSAWELLITRFDDEGRLKRTIISKLHFVDEVTREMELASKNVNSKENEEKKKKSEVTKEETILIRWLETLDSFFYSFKQMREDSSFLIFMKD
ncbi:uncharacterized protein MONOS_4342 [Monocercomonoides exilis]|uniref:uncharacterized protein n=1 Tax=Monocercomonoides exilis TaxID=2049356 RepID=UPI003559B365|nr:hypothetical protein MONOS_4342 [Monocercomonoides exilis]|eukprot:MONOS_4342.1-p1 / transcript=MONOS_4342.1 / gene=MONOS_4342 / organism=Monocercomonoides_exilis_PA203 / gene_product=unspecified product / transcript_product=unspecified product / location=Mono_scaffold00114:65994-66686(+) / protein_length=135 / sequence_SO=supercontig / SO=protein_coding / is_pseudo=false